MLFNKTIRGLVSLVTVIALFTLVSFSVYAADISGLTISDTAGKLVVEGTSVTAETGSGSWISKKANTITITNTSGKAGVLSLHYEATNYNSFTIAGASADASGDYSADLGVDGSVKFYIQSKSSGYASLKLSGVVLSDPNASYNVTFSYDNTIGSVSVGGEAVSPNTVKSITGAGVEVIATPISGSSFLGWVNTATNELLSTSAKFSLKANAEMTVRAVFTNASSNAWFAVGTVLFDDLNSAITYATNATSKIIVPAASGRLPSGPYIIPDGVTLLIPYNADYTCNTTPKVLGSHTTPSAFRTLTMDNGASITVERGGAINVASEVSATGTNAASWNGTPTGPHGRIDMKAGSSITLESGADLYAYGYIAGTGNILAESGSTVYECFQIRDWRGGSATCGSTANAARGKLNSVFTDNDIFPVNQCYVQNIEAKLTIEGGATEKIFAAANAASVTPSTTATFIGSGGMFSPASGKSVTKYYSASDDRLVLEIDGNAELSSMAISFYIILGTMDLNSANFVFPVPNNMTIRINSGTTTVSQDIALVPGTEMIINKDASLVLSEGTRAYIYDKAEWGAYAADSLQLVPVGYSAANGTTTIRNDGSLNDAKIDVNGEVIINGNAYTTKNGANITSSKGIGKVTIKAVGTETNTYQATQTGTTMAKVDIPITAPQLKNGNGDYVATEAGDYVYDATHQKWALTAHTVTDEVTPPTCQKTGYTTHTCSCGYSYMDSDTEALGHTAVSDANPNGDPIASATPATCTDAGVEFDYWKCAREGCGVYYKVENDTQIAVEENAWVIPALGHTPGEAATCTTAQTCTVCNAELAAALNHDFSGTWQKNDANHWKQCSRCGATDQNVAHSMGDWIVDTAATCTTAGSQHKKCAICDHTVTEAIDALGHNMVSVEAKAATCTEAGYNAHTDCSRCDYTEGKSVISATGHNYGDPTYTGDGKTSYVATRKCTCGDTQTATAKITSAVTKAATCTAEGETTYTADFTETWAEDKTTTEPIAKLAHSYGKPQFTWNGYACTAKVICSCGDKQGVEVTVTSAETTEATCTVKGVKTYTATAEWNEQTYTSAEHPTEDLGLNSSNHKNTTNHEQTDATCTSNGYTAGTYCEDCKQWISGHEEISQAAHSHGDKWKYDETNHWHECVCGDQADLAEHGWDDGVVTTQPTFSAAGVKTYTCGTCGTTRSETIDKLTGTTVSLDVLTNNLETGPRIALLTGTTAGEGWDKEGNVIAGSTVDFSVTFDKACVVIVETTDTDGNLVYTKVPAVATADKNTYTFSTNVVEGMKIIVAVKGDLDSNGKINSTDAMKMQQAEVGLLTLEKIQKVICDIDGNNKINSTDAMLAQQVEVGLTSLAWDK